MLQEAQAKALIKETVRETFLALGIDISDAEAVINYQKDQHHLRSERLRGEAVLNKGLLHLFSVLISAALATMFIGALDVFGVTHD